MWPELRRLLLAVADPKQKRIAVRACRKVSKTTADAIAALWWPLHFPDGKVFITASGNRTIETVVWAEVRLRYMEAAKHLDLPKCAKLPHVGIHWDDGRAIFGYSTNEAEKVQGISGNVLYIVDEASGVESSIIHAILGNLASGGKLLMTSNPTRPGGFFYDVFQKAPRDWLLVHIRAAQSPNVLAGETIIPGLASQEWIDEMAEMWGEGSALYDVHVNGEFPGQADDAIIALADINAARERYRQACDKSGKLPASEADGPIEVGVDVARFGDDSSVIIARRGFKLVELDTLRNADGPTVAGRALRMARDHYLGPEDSYPPIRVDEIGVGSSVIDALARCDGVRVIPINVSRVASDEDRFVNQRAELWFNLAQWIKDGGMLPDDERLAAELATPRYTYADASKGRMMVEPKSETKKRLGRSPDLADALALAVCGGQSAGPLVMPFSAGHSATANGSTPRWAHSPGRGFG